MEKKTENLPKNTKQGRRKGVLAYQENPFWKATEVKVGQKKITVAGGMHVSPEGESLLHSGVHIVREVDESEFLKVYTKNIRAIFDLRPSTQRVIQYLMVELQKTPNSDAVYLDWIGAEKYFKANSIKISRASFYSSLKELIEKSFLAESDRSNMFWFNPNLFFNGNRMIFVNDFIKTKKEKIEKIYLDSHYHR